LRVHICQRLVADYQGTQRAFKRVRRVQVADMKRYDEFYKRLVNSVPGLSDVTSSFAMEQIKYTTSLPIE
ncbi:Lrp/AsnC ligand binding domain-containing protein, partial [Escherichia sp. R-CC3]